MERWQRHDTEQSRSRRDEQIRAKHLPGLRLVILK